MKRLYDPCLPWHPSHSSCSIYSTSPLTRNLQSDLRLLLSSNKVFVLILAEGERGKFHTSFFLIVDGERLVGNIPGTFLIVTGTKF